MYHSKEQLLCGPAYRTCCWEPVVVATSCVLFRGAHALSEQHSMCLTLCCYTLVTSVRHSTKHAVCHSEELIFVRPAQQVWYGALPQRVVDASQSFCGATWPHVLIVHPVHICCQLY